MRNNVSEDTVVGLGMLFEMAASCDFSQISPEEQHYVSSAMRDMEARDQITITDIEEVGQQYGNSKAAAQKVVKFFTDAGIRLKP